MFFFFNDTATTEIYTLSLHDALPIFKGLEERIDVYELVGAGESRTRLQASAARGLTPFVGRQDERAAIDRVLARSEEHTSELQSRQYLVCRLLLEKKKNKFSVASYLI